MTRPLPPSQRPDADSARYRKIFYLTLLIFTALLAITGNIVWPTPRWDIYEMIGAGREWVIGNFRGDLSSAWIARISCAPFDEAPFAVYIASALCTAGTIWCVWRLAREYLDAKRACFAALLLTTFYYTCIGGIFYNRNVVHCLFWYLSILIYYHAL
ncbi:MAG: glycosyltransferase family 39 protein, partial [Thermoguttaceae bacterium]|nr:glycosyltransferase family 39 protein [Thermoguttaceae bacterium]